MTAGMRYPDPLPHPDDTPDERLHELERRVDARVFEHRRSVRHLMAVIRALVRRTAHSGGSVEDFAAHLVDE